MCRKEGCCSGCCCNQNLLVAIFGMTVSSMALLFAAVYNFHTFGFCLALVGMLTSGLYVFFILKSNKLRANYESLPADESLTLS